MVSEYWLRGLNSYLKVVGSFATERDCYLIAQNGAKIYLETEQRRLDAIAMMIEGICADVETEIAALSLSSDHGAIGEDTRVTFPKHEFDIHKFVDRLRAQFPELFEVLVRDPSAPPEVPPR